MKIIDKETKKEVRFPSIEEIQRKTGCSVEESKRKIYRKIIRFLYIPNYGAFLSISKTMKRVLTRYRYAKLVPYRPTAWELTRIRNNPKYINALPKYYVPELDKILDSKEFEYRLRDEFVERFLSGDIELVKMVNLNNPRYKVEL